MLVLSIGALALGPGDAAVDDAESADIASISDASLTEASDAEAGATAANDAEAGDAPMDAADATLATDAGATDVDLASDAGVDVATDATDATDASDAGDGGDPTLLLPTKEEPAPPRDATEATDIVVRTMVGLSLLVFLAYLGAHPRVRRLEERLGLTQLITAGFPFIALGLVAQFAGVLSSEVVAALTPLLQFGIGWLGFVVGFRFDVRFLDRVPAGTGLAVALATTLPFVAIVIVCATVMLTLGWVSGDLPFLRDAVALGAAGAMSTARVGQPKTTAEAQIPSDDLPKRIGQLDEIAGVAAFAFLAAYFRPEGALTQWELTGTAWLFITLGMGVAIGLVLYGALSLKATGSEFLAITLGSVAFAAGMAGYLHLSPIVVCFIAGALATNLPFRHKEQLRAILTKLERPILLVFLTMTGALWNVGDWRGWVLVPAFVFARIVGRGAAVITLRTRQTADIPLDREQRLLIAPVSILSIAIVLGVQSLYGGGTVGWVVTAVIGGALVFELLSQLVTHTEVGSAAKEAES